MSHVQARTTTLPSIQKAHMDEYLSSNLTKCGFTSRPKTDKHTNVNHDSRLWGLNLKQAMDVQIAWYQLLVWLERPMDRDMTSGGGEIVYSFVERDWMEAFLRVH